ncbi:MAG TPA: FAD-dependent oxidoreductase [Fimbriimonas sp.]
MSSDRHVAIVGAGIVGLCVADALLARGMRVTVVEREEDPTGGCSYGNGGMIVPSHFVPLAAPGMISMGLRMMLDRQSPFGVERLYDFQTLAWLARFSRAACRRHVETCSPLLRDLNVESRDLYESLVARLGVPTGFEKRGLLMLSRTAKAHHAEAVLAAQACRLGLNAVVLDRDDLARKEPGLEMDVVGAVCFEEDAHLTPSAFMEGLRRLVVEQGGTILDGAEVCGLRKRGARVESLELEHESIGADEFVLAAGAWTGRLAASVGLRLPMLAGRGYGLTVSEPPQRPTIPAILTEARVAVTPMLDGVRFVGTLELAEPNLIPSPSRVQGMKRSIPLYYPAFEPSHLAGPVWCGLRPCSPDGMPYIGRTRAASNLVVAAGHAMMGMSLGPATGKTVSQIVLGETSRHRLDLLSPDRYA